MKLSYILKFFLVLPCTYAYSHLTYESENSPTFLDDETVLVPEEIPTGAVVPNPPTMFFESPNYSNYNPDPQLKEKVIKAKSSPAFYTVNPESIKNCFETHAGLSRKEKRYYCELKKAFSSLILENLQDCLARLSICLNYFPDLNTLEKVTIHENIIILAATICEGFGYDISAFNIKLAQYQSDKLLNDLTPSDDDSYLDSEFDHQFFQNYFFELTSMMPHQVYEIAASLPASSCKDKALSLLKHFTN